jgi:hypothetical protein
MAGLRGKPDEFPATSELAKKMLQFCNAAMLSLNFMVTNIHHQNWNVLNELDNVTLSICY